MARGAGGGGGGDLADILERVLDKGVVIAGDIAINLLDIELLTIKLRLLVASADTAKQMGIDWWTRDAFLTGHDRDSGEDEQRDDERRGLEARIERLETMIASLPERIAAANASPNGAATSPNGEATVSTNGHRPEAPAPGTTSGERATR